MVTGWSLELSVAQEREWKDSSVNINVQVLVGQAQIGGGVLALGRRVEFRSRSRGILFQQFQEPSLTPFVSVARV